MKEDNLIFIVSQPRSGSTLLQGLLSNNDSVNTTSESWLLLPFLNIFDNSLVEAKYDNYLATTGVFDFANKVGGKDVLIKKLRDFLLDVYRPLSVGNVKYILDKTPRYYEILPYIRKVFPEAKIILLKRNPFAVLNSIIETWGETNTISDLYPYKRDILYAPFLIHAFLEENRSDDQHVREVIYENLIQNPEKEVKALYEWLEIPYDSSVLDYSKNDRYKGLMGDQEGTKEKDVPSSEDADTWQKKFTDSYWSDFFKGYHAFLGKEFLSSYGNYSTESLGKNIHETPQFQKFKYFSEDKFIDINFVDAIKNYERYDLTIKQLKIQEEQLEHQKNTLNFQKAQLEEQKKQQSVQKEQFKYQKAVNDLQKKYEQSESDSVTRLEVIQKKYEQLNKEVEQRTQERDEKANVLMQLKQAIEKGKKAFEQLINEKDCALRQLKQEKEQKESIIKQLRQDEKSLSMRITAPFRQLFNVLRGLKR